ncbi:MAG: aminotransferase class V-fold PLP-dependent enzyme [Pseudomonadota bacterium]|nr:aminotransferase class V-fold PLP-dependent enzyme [Pseudomonadota bacterium]
MNTGRRIADAQIALARARRPSVPLLDRLLLATTPAEIAATVAAAKPYILEDLFDAAGPTPGQLRLAHAAELGISASDLAYRALHPGLDIGIYACSHSMGIPSVAGPAAVMDQLAQLERSGIGVWDDGVWPAVMDQFRERCAQLVGGTLSEGDTTWFPNVSEALSAVLEGFDGGTLVYTAGHFTTGHYVHHQWAQNTGGTLREVPLDADGSVPTARLVDAITPDTKVLSISHALFESGWLQDLPAIAAALREKAPGALLLLDAYQTAGSVPIEAAALGDHVAVTAGGHKQLRSSAGAAFLYMPRRWLRTLTPKRTGWWNHADPFAFEKGAVRRGTDGTRFQTGTPTLAGMAMLLGELASLASSTDGSLHDAVGRARRVTSSLVGRAIERARKHGLEVRGGWSPERRSAFVCLVMPDGARLNEELARQGIRVDFRPLVPGSPDGLIRVGTNSAGFGYEIDAVIDAIAEHRTAKA